MNRALIFLALWAASPTPGQVGSTALYTEFQHPPSAAVFQAVREEVTSLLAPDGLHFEWRSLPQTDNQVWLELAVLRFKGHCEILPFAQNSNYDRRLGWTHISERVVMPFADVDCDAIGAYVHERLSAQTPDSRDRLFGRAIGRVVAHELLHVFARTAHHSSEGVDQPALSVDELLADRPVVSGEEQALHILHAGTVRNWKPFSGSAQVGRAHYVSDGCSTCHGVHAEGTRRGPVLRVAGRILNSVILAAKLAKSEKRMCQRAKSLKLGTPSLSEEELDDLACFFSDVQQSRI